MTPEQVLQMEKLETENDELALRVRGLLLLLWKHDILLDDLPNTEEEADDLYRRIEFSRECDAIYEYDMRRIREDAEATRTGATP